jgi:peroxiredoxin
MELTRSLSLALALALLLGCSGAAPSAALRLPAVPLVAKTGERVELSSIVQGGQLTLLVFFSRNCKCFAAHEDRLRALHDTYGPRGMTVVLVDSEANSTPDGDALEAARRGFPYPLLLDPGARLADALGAGYATYSVVVDRHGVVRYRGGFDSDRNHLRKDATPYVQDAIDDLLAGRQPRLAEAKTLGCALEKW